jgi:transmembrane 9 superfamily protein 2/4
MGLLSSATAALLLGACAQAFYLPGAAPHDYALGDQVNVFVNALTPMLLGKDDAKLVSNYSCGIPLLMTAYRNRNLC